MSKIKRRTLRKKKLALNVKDSWIQSILTQDHFQKIDLWLYTLIKHSGRQDPLKNLDYCVLIRKHSSLNREVVFSPNCFHKLSEVQPDFLLLDTKVIPKPELIGMLNNKQSFIYWFGNINYFVKICPPEAHTMD